MNIKAQFAQAASIQPFRAGHNRYARLSYGPFIVQRYVPKQIGEREFPTFPQMVAVNPSHPDHDAAVAFVAKRDRLVRRAQDRGISISVV